MFEKLIERVDEMYGASLLTGIGAYALYLGLDGGVVAACVAGIIALLAVQSVNKK